MTYNPDNQLPAKLTITMWDFSWYTMTLPGEPYHDLAARFAEAVERGYNTIRICAMPFLLFTADGPRPGPLKFGSLGKVGQRTRWYNCSAEPSLTDTPICLSCLSRRKRMTATLCCPRGNISRARAFWPIRSCAMSWRQLHLRTGSWRLPNQ